MAKRFFSLRFRILALSGRLFVYGDDQFIPHNTMWPIGLTVQEIVVLVYGDILFTGQGKKLIDLKLYFR